MKLSADCIRDVMLEIEKSWSLSLCDGGGIHMGTVGIDDLCRALPEHSKEDIFYSLYNLDQAGFINISVLWASGRVAVECAVNYMTYSGHEFLNSIRDPKRWSLIKSGLKAVRSYSLDVVAAISKGISNAAIDKFVNGIEL